MIDIIGASPHIVIIEKKDFDKPPTNGGCWEQVDILLIPEGSMLHIPNNDFAFSVLQCLSENAMIATYFKDSKTVFHTTHTYTIKQFTNLYQ